jgi:hypothetical protein
MNKDFFDSWYFLVNHKVFNVKTIEEKGSVAKILLGDDNKLLNSRHSYFEKCLDFMVVKINPKTNEIELEDNSLNTKTKIWIEISTPMIDKDGDYGIKGEMIFSADLDCYCGGDTFEDAIIKLASLVGKKYGEDVESSIIVLDKTK